MAAFKIPGGSIGLNTWGLGWRGAGRTTSAQSGTSTTGVFVNGKQVADGKTTLAITSASSALANGLHRVPVKISGADVYVSFDADGWHVTNMSPTVPVRVKEVGQRQTDLSAGTVEVAPSTYSVPSTTVRPGTVILEFGTGKNTEAVTLTLPDLPPPARVTPAPTRTTYIKHPPLDPARESPTMAMPRARGGMSVTDANREFLKSWVFRDGVINATIIDGVQRVEVRVDHNGQMTAIAPSNQSGSATIVLNASNGRVMGVEPAYRGAVSDQALTELQRLIDRTPD